MGDVVSRAAVAFVIAFNAIHCAEDIIHGGEPEEALAAGKKLAEAGFLRDHRAAGSKVTCGAVAEPASAGTNVLVASNREFSARRLNVFPIAIHVARHFDGTDLSPAILCEQVLHLAV